MSPATAPISLAQQVALSVIPRVTGTLSILGSGAIICRIIGSRDRRSKVYHRLLMEMSCCDIFASFAIALSSWPVPRGYPGVYDARGTVGTCKAQGFVLQMFGLAVPIYNACLGLYYLLVINYGWQESRLRTAAAPWMYVTPISVGIVVAVACLLLNLVNPTNAICWIARPKCEQDLTNGGGGTKNCTSYGGHSARIFVVAFLIVIIVVSMLVATATMSMVYLYVRKQERKAARYRYGENDSQKQTKQVAKQALLYVLAFWATWTPMIINGLMAVSVDSRGYGWYPLTVVQVILIPLQGFFNAMVYFRPLRAYKRFLAQSPDSLAARVAGLFSSRLNSSEMKDVRTANRQNNRGRDCKETSAASNCCESTSGQAMGNVERDEE